MENKVVANSIYRQERKYIMGISHADVALILINYLKEKRLTNQIYVFCFLLFYSLRHSPKVKNLYLSFSYFPSFCCFDNSYLLLFFS